MTGSFDHLQLNGRVAVVTGGSRGIGRGIVELLAERGAAVGLAFRERERPAREVEACVRARGGRAWAGQCDVSVEASVLAFFFEPLRASKFNARAPFCLGAVETGSFQVVGPKLDV